MKQKHVWMLWATDPTEPEYNFLALITTSKENCYAYIKKIDPDNDPDDLIEDGHYRLDHSSGVEVEI
jgi:hypothetical protein